MIRNIHYWLPSYLLWLLLPKEKVKRNVPVHILFCFCDHFDLGYDRVSSDVCRKRMDIWMERYPKLAQRHQDADGAHPQHTWFFPPHYDESDHLARLVELCKRGFGEIELHFHHDQIPPLGVDDSQRFREKLNRTLDSYGRLGIFCFNGSTKRRFGFIHGDWALDNSKGGKFCGVNDELTILKEAGCYADFTFPSCDESQPAKVNSLYYAKDDPKKPKSYNTGSDLKVGGKEEGDLMIVEGPLGLSWQKRNHLFLPRVENSSVESFNPPTPERFDCWINTGIHVKGRPEWVFVKVYTHGTPERSHQLILGDVADAMYGNLESKYNDGSRFILHYVTARELYNIAKAAEAGKTGDPGEYRDFIIPRYKYLK